MQPQSDNHVPVTNQPPISGQTDRVGIVNDLQMSLHLDSNGQVPGVHVMPPQAAVHHQIMNNGDLLQHRQQIAVSQGSHGQGMSSQAIPGRQLPNLQSHPIGSNSPLLGIGI